MTIKCYPDFFQELYNRSIKDPFNGTFDGTDMRKSLNECFSKSHVNTLFRRYIQKGIIIQIKQNKGSRKGTYIYKISDFFIERVRENPQWGIKLNRQE